MRARQRSCPRGGISDGPAENLVLGSNHSKGQILENHLTCKHYAVSEDISSAT
jgi:hypothetical protein